MYSEFSRGNAVLCSPAADLRLPQERLAPPYCPAGTTLAHLPEADDLQTTVDRSAADQSSAQ